uniref:Uncharacterized protein n=1 Tax=Romanomermis culicivorax TaxID=13658 RepID=A0A915HHD0_ROMCU
MLRYLHLASFVCYL